jgi:hypothetical protein
MENEFYMKIIPEISLSLGSDADNFNHIVEWQRRPRLFGPCAGYARKYAEK